ncbi:MAG: hypothetical protein IT463_09885 [Planctomycetes bacterium]|nr:hypothetical protein [Planctomycetota bacterium]
MDGLKKNLHFVVFGAGVMVGIVLLGVGHMVKSGKQDQLAAATAALPKTGAVFTQGDVDDLRKQRGGFDGSLSAAQDALGKTTGVALRSSMGTHRDGTAFWSSDEGNSALSRLQERFRALEKPVAIPPQAGERTLAAPDTKFWDETRNSMSTISDPKQILQWQLQIRLLQEVAFVCEQLTATEAFAGQGVRLASLRMDMKSAENLPADQPWEEYGFTLVVEASPSFCVTLMDQLVNPTAATAGDAAKAKEGKGRWLFPVQLEQMQIELMERPHTAMCNISTPEQKQEWGLDVNFDPTTEAGKRKVEELSKKLQDEVRLKLPVRCGLKMKALQFNANWLVVKPAENQ